MIIPIAALVIAYLLFRQNAHAADSGVHPQQAAKKVAKRLDTIRTLPPHTVNALAQSVSPSTANPHDAAPSLPSSTPSGPRSPEKAASDLKGYLTAGGDPGHKGKVSQFVKAAQKDMGGLTADGIYGPKTKARARALGVVIDGSAPRTSHASQSTSLARSQKQAAADLKNYLAQGGNPGSKGNPSSYVKAAQHDMGGLTADGIMGPKTKARAKALGSAIA